MPVQRPISVITNIHRRLVTQVGNRKSKSIGLSLSNLTEVPRAITGGQSDSISNTLKLALLNVRSLAGKSFVINDFITKHNLDFMFLTETWLDQNNSTAVLIVGQDCIRKGVE